MKLRTSSFDKTIFRKNLTRFAPCWGLYTVCALMGLILLISDGSRWMADNLLSAAHVLCVITPIYAMICALLLFGDLYNTRMCNALHALPLKRETWFFTNVISGFVFHLIPTLTLTVLAAPILAFYSVENAIWSAPLFLVISNLQFACYFGLAVFCAFCVGNRFAMGLLYAIINFASIIAGWLVDTIFVPMYYGIRINTAPFQLFSPIVQMANSPFADIHRVYESEVANYRNLVAVTFSSAEGTVYYFVVAAIGIALLFAALALYRRRKLESAGDFLAVQALEPVFLVVYSVILGAVFHFIVNEMMGMDTYLFFFLGLAIGWFTGKMLLERSARVFRKKNILRCVLLLIICFAIILGAYLDPFGIEDWVPKADKVASVTICEGSYRYPNSEITLESPEDIARIIQVHRYALDSRYVDYQTPHTFEDAYAELIVIPETAPDSDTVEYYYGSMEHYSSFTISYQLTSGRTVRRYYSIWLGDEYGTYLKHIFSRPESVFGYSEDLTRFLSENSRVSVRDTWEGNETVIRSQYALTELYQAILADCHRDNMAQSWTFHRLEDSLYWIYLETGEEITVFSDCTYTLTFLRSYGINVDEILQNHGK